MVLRNTTSASSDILCVYLTKILCWPPHSPAAGVCNLWEIMLEIVCVYVCLCVYMQLSWEKM